MNVISRPYTGAADFARLQAFLAHARAAVSQTHYLHTGDLTWQLFHMLADLDPSQLVHIWEDQHAALIGATPPRRAGRAPVASLGVAQRQGASVDGTIGNAE